MSTVTITIAGKDAASPAFDAAGKSLRNLTTQSNAVTASLQKQERQLSSTEKELAAMRGGLDASASTLGKLAVPFAAASVASVKMASDFDSSLHNINSIAGLSQDQLGKLGKSFVDLSLDQTKTFEGAGALADGFYDIQSSGFAGAEGMKVLEASTKAASAGMSTTKTAANAISATLNAYGQSADDAAHVSDVLFQTVNLGVVKFEELSGSIGRVIPTAASAKVSIEEVGAAVSTMTKSGLAGAQAVTDLNSLINNVIKPTTDASAAAKTMGLDFSFAALQSKGLAGFMTDVMHATGGNAEAMGKLFTSQEALTAALSITKGEMKGFTSDLDGMNHAAGKTDAAFQEMSKSTTAQFQRLKANFEALGITVGSALLPRVNDAVKGINGLVTAFTKLPEDEQKRWIDIATGLGGATVAMYAMTKATQGAIATWEAGTKVFAGVRAAVALAGGALGILAIPLAAVGVMVATGIHDWNAYAAALDAQAKSLSDHNELLTGAAAVQERFAASLIASTPAGQEQIATLVKLQAEHANLQRQIVEQEGLSTPFGVNEELERLKTLLTENEQALDATSTHMDQMTSSTERAKVALSEQASAIQNTGSAFQTAGQASHAMAAALDATQASVALTDDQLKTLNKTLDDTGKEGLGAFSDMLATTAKSFDGIADLTTKHWETIAGIDKELSGKMTGDRRRALEDQRADEETSYGEALANQLVAQGQELASEKTHLGQMLIEQVNAMAAMNHVSDERRQELVDGIAKSYGVLPDLASTAFGKMKTSIGDWATDSAISAASVVGDMEKTATSTIDTREEMERLAKKYTAELETNFAEHKISADELTDAISKIPAKVYSEVMGQQSVRDATNEYRILYDATAKIPPLTTANTATNTQETTGLISETTAALDLLDRHPIVDKQITTNAPEMTGQIDDTTRAYRELAGLPVPDKAITTNAPEITGQINTAGSAYSGLAALPHPDLHITTNAGEVAALLSGVSAAMGSIPTSKTIRIAAGIDPMLMRHSPSPLEQEMAYIDEFTQRDHVFRFTTTGTPGLDAIAKYTGAKIPTLSGVGYAGSGASAGMQFMAGMQLSILKGMPDLLAAMRRSTDSSIQEIVGSVDLGDSSIFNQTGADAVNAFIARMAQAAAGTQDLGDGLKLLGDQSGTVQDLGDGLKFLGDQWFSMADAAKQAAATVKTTDDILGHVKLLGDGSNPFGFTGGSGNPFAFSGGGGGLGALADYAKQAGTGAGMGFGEGWHQGIEQIAPQMQAQTQLTFDQLQATVLVPWQDNTRTFFGAAGFGFIGAASEGMNSAGGGLAQSAGNVGGAAGASLVAGLRGNLGGVANAVTDINAALAKIEREIVVHVSVVRDDGGATGQALSFPKFASGVRNFGGGVAMVGDVAGGSGELVALPRGSDVYSNRESRSILSGMARDATARLSAQELMPLIAALKDIMTQHAYSVVQAIHETRQAEAIDPSIAQVWAG